MSLFEIRSKLLLFLHWALFCRTRILLTDVSRCKRTLGQRRYKPELNHRTGCSRSAAEKKKKEKKEAFAASQQIVILHTWARIGSTGPGFTLGAFFVATTFHTMKSSGRGWRGGRGGVEVEGVGGWRTGLQEHRLHNKRREPPAFEARGWNISDTLSIIAAETLQPLLWQLGRTS